jgi:hypothetical protein
LFCHFVILQNLKLVPRGRLLLQSLEIFLVNVNEVSFLRDTFDRRSILSTRDDIFFTNQISRAYEAKGVLVNLLYAIF